jgi:pimeloyl-ACP methyl ester carboxylesterase
VTDPADDLAAVVRETDLGPDLFSAIGIFGRAAALDAFVASLPEQALWPFDRATVRDNGLAVTCLNWPPTPEPAPEPPDGQDLPDVPVLMVVGDRDLSTPIELARQEEARAPRVELVVIPDAGHSPDPEDPTRPARPSSHSSATADVHRHPWLGHPGGDTAISVRPATPASRSSNSRLRWSPPP